MSEVVKKATRQSYGEALAELADKYENLVVLAAGGENYGDALCGDNEKEIF